MNCILCTSSVTLLHAKVDTHYGPREYYHCQGECGLVFLNPEQRLTAAQEQERYELHNNDAKDPNYRAFLERLANPLSAFIEKGMLGLDFGCGPTPLMSTILEERGLLMRHYDAFFFNNESVLKKQYDVITASEVFEHLFDPATEIERLVSMLHSGGVLGVMTGILTGPERFAQWWYHRDPTHVVFFSERTFAYIAQRWNMEPEHSDTTIWIARKK